MPNANVLIVEDDDSIRRLLIEYLKEHAGFSVDGARDGVDALHHVTNHHYAVVVLDVMMPYMTGIDFLDSLQALTNDPSTKKLDRLPSVVIVTSASQEQVPSDTLLQRFPSMVRAVLRKPVDCDALTRCVESLLR